MIDIIYQEAINNKIQYHSEQIGRIKELSNREPVWSEPKYLFYKKRGNVQFSPTGISKGAIGVYRIIYKPTMETMSIGCGVAGDRVIRHRRVFLNKGKVERSANSYSGSQTGTLMYQLDRHRKNWLFSWCSIDNRSLAREYEDLLIELETPLFNDKSMGGK
tara:strand:- start:291 stop:773 length:483 start_codon:yes stop_codon:yes gene_type:complete